MISSGSNKVVELADPNIIKRIKTGKQQDDLTNNSTPSIPISLPFPRSHSSTLLNINPINQQPASQFEKPVGEIGNQPTWVQIPVLPQNNPEKGEA
jgi:hypothetical protein